MKPYKLVVTSCTDPKGAHYPKTDAVRRILDHWGYDHRQYVDNLWFGWASKLIHMVEVCETFADFTHIMFIDAFDIVVLAGADEVMERFFALNHPWVYNAEVNIFSPGSFQPDDYPPCDTPFRYLNAGACIAEQKHMMHWYAKWTSDGEAIPRHLPGGDQDWVAEHFLSGYPDAIKLDTGCELFQCACGAQMGDNPIIEVSKGRVHNRITNTDPLIIHFNGGTDITDDKRRVLWEHLV